MKMNILGIDFGEKHVGLALGSTEIGVAEILRKELRPEQLNEIKNICRAENVNKIVVGISEGKSAERAMNFADNLRKNIRIQVEFYDETLSTRDAISKLSYKSAKNRSKLEHSAAAAVILQNWLADNV